mmetsp:Transcript_19567/g.35884  ORF Transcript_19567/g.35884 Transcript_19567/m.35884 type:complete len:300 (+) Transcript_19567:2407-3306(+)
MDWVYGERANLKRRLFLDAAQDSRLNVPSPRQSDNRQPKSPIRSASTQARAKRDAASELGYISNYYDTGLRVDRNESPYTNLPMHLGGDSENIRPNESKLNESVLLKIQRHELDSLGAFLKRLGLEDYESVFIDNQISPEDLPLLTREDLADMGIPIGPRNRILNALQAERLETPLSSKRETSLCQASPGSTSSSKSAVRLQLHQEVQQFISGINSSDKRRVQQSRPPVVPESKFSKPPRDSKDSMSRMLEDLSRRQELMLKAIEQNSQAMKLIAETRFATRAHSPYMMRPRSVSMKRV